MSNAIAQSTNAVAISPVGEDNYNFADAVNRAAQRKVGKSGITTERKMLKRNDLISACCADYRAHFASIYGKSDRLPSDIHGKMVEAVDSYLAVSLQAVNGLNVISQRRGFYHDHRNFQVTERVVNTGENSLGLSEQLFGINCILGEAERRLKAFLAEGTPDHDKQMQYQAAVMKATLTKQFITREIANQEKVKAEAATKQ